MKAIAICGSPRKNGNTETLLTRCLDGLAKDGIETEFVGLRGKKITPCIACGKCKETKDQTCAQKGDDFAEIFKKLVEADIIVVGSPVYFGSATAQITALLDRAGYVSRANGNLFSRKIGGPISVARRAGQNFTLAQLLYWFLICDMVVVGSSYWNMAIGTNPGEVNDDAEGLATVDRFAENLVWVSKKCR